MGKTVRPCCIPNCRDRESARYHIPMDEAIRAIWLDRIQNQKLFTIEDAKVLGYYVVCGIHIADICKVGGKLKRYSLPTLSLPSFNEESNIETCFARPPSQAQIVITPKKLREALSKMGSVASEAFETSPVSSVQVPQRTYSRKRTRLFTPQPSTSSASDIVEAIVELRRTSPAPSTSSSKRRRIEVHATSSYI